MDKHIVVLEELAKKWRSEALAARERAERARHNDRDLHAANCASHAETCDKHAAELESAIALMRAPVGDAGNVHSSLDVFDKWFLDTLPMVDMDANAGGKSALVSRGIARKAWLAAITMSNLTEVVDAARYRYMRDAMYRGPIHIGEAYVDLSVVGVCPTQDEFDAGIDAAMKATIGGAK